MTESTIIITLTLKIDGETITRTLTSDEYPERKKQRNTANTAK